MVISLWMPKVTHSHGEKLEHGKTRVISFYVVENLVWIKIAKQRAFHPVTLRRMKSGDIWPLLIREDNSGYDLIDPREVERVTREIAIPSRSTQGKPKIY